MMSGSMSSDRQVAEIEVHTAGRKLRLVWKCAAANEQGQHFADLVAVEEAARAVRSRIKALANCIEQEQDNDGAITDVAEAGRRLYDELVPENTDLRAFLSKSRNLDLHIGIIDNCQLPWGAIFSGKQSDRDGGPGASKDFWCIKHNVIAYQPSAAENYRRQAASKNRLQPISYVPQSCKRPQDSLFCCNREIFDINSKEYRYWTWALYLREPSPPEPRLGLDLNIVRQTGARLNDARASEDCARLTGMIFIDGIDVRIDEPPGTELLREVWRNWQGLVVSEVPIARELDFCVTLVENAKSGQRISDLVREVRIELWPCSLLYGVYCVPEFAFEKP